MNISELVAQLRAEKEECVSQLLNLRQSVEQAESEIEILDMMIDRIAATDEARAATVSPAAAVDGADHRPSRKPRRDIRALVRAAISNGAYSGGWSPEERIAHLSKDLGCRPSLIKAALRPFEKEDWWTFNPIDKDGDDHENV